MAGDDQHTDQDAAADEGTANKGAPPTAPDAGAHALEDAGGRDSDVGAGAVSPPAGLLAADVDATHVRVELMAAAKAAEDVSSVVPPADADDAHIRVALVAAAKAAGDVSSVLLRSAGGGCLGMLRFV